MKGCGAEKEKRGGGGREGGRRIRNGGYGVAHTRWHGRRSRGGPYREDEHALPQLIVLLATRLDVLALGEHFREGGCQLNGFEERIGRLHCEQPPSCWRGTTAV